MHPTIPATSPAEISALSPATSGFVLSASLTFLFNTVLALAKDAYPALNGLMKSLTGHHWTTHGLADLFVFLALGFLFMGTGATKKMSAARLTGLLVATTAIATLGLVVWYVFD